jgi:Zn-dependent peptidase ImmA (M78 family)/predicted secreted protein
MQIAGEALYELNIDQSRPIDPFPIIGELGLKLAFQPLGGLLGAILDPTADLANPGVLITTSRGAGTQRYTAAHEIGHWFMHREQLASDPAADGIAEIYGSGHSAPREREAQLFAAYFLMPLPLVGSVARTYGVRRNGEVTPTQLYSIARDLRVSYEAAARQLTNPRFISRDVRDNLLRTKPARVKKVLGHGRPPTHSGADVWLVDQPGDRTIDAYVGDDVVVSLAENPTTGYRWMSRESYEQVLRARTAPSAPSPFGNGVGPTFAVDHQVVVPQVVSSDEHLRPVADRFLQHDSGTEVVGQGGERIVTLVADRKGVWTTDLVYASPFDPAAPVEELALRVDVLNGPEQWAKDARIASVRDEPQ